MNRRDFIKLCGCAALAPMGMAKALVKEPVIPSLQDIFNELVRFKMNECQDMMRRQLYKAMYAPVILKCEVIQDGMALHCPAIPKCTVIDGTDFFNYKPPPNK